MADQEMLDILKKGGKFWNKWREKNDYIINLSKADLRGLDLREVNFGPADKYVTNLSYANFSDSNLEGAYLKSANLSRANFRRAKLGISNLIGANLYKANLSQADLTAALLYRANLFKANFRKANLRVTDFSNADLTEVDFSNAILKETEFNRSNLDGAKFNNAQVGGTIFARVNLDNVLGLEEVVHTSSSTIGSDTLWFSQGKIPENFLRGCGLSDVDIEYAKLANPNLTNEDIVKIQYRIFDLRATRAFQISPLFISYSHGDTAFVDILENRLIAKGIRFWRDIHDMTSGKIETQIDYAIKQNPIVLLVLSKNSLKSDWVQHEVRKAREVEKEIGRDTICPIALDDSWKSANWPQRIMEQIMEYNILDFSAWQDKSTFQIKFSKLLQGLDIFYKKPS